MPAGRAIAGLHTPCNLTPLPLAMTGSRLQPPTQPITVASPSDAEQDKCKRLSKTQINYQSPGATQTDKLEDAAARSFRSKVEATRHNLQKQPTCPHLLAQIKTSTCPNQRRQTWLSTVTPREHQSLQEAQSIQNICMSTECSDAISKNITHTRMLPNNQLSGHPFRTLLHQKQQDRAAQSQQEGMGQ